jgi:hypothetical protein
MQLVDDAFFPGPATPIRIIPFIFGGIDHLAGAVDVERLEAGRWIRDVHTVGQDKLVQR